MFQKHDRYSIGYRGKTVYRYSWFSDGREYTNGRSSFRRIRRSLTKINPDHVYLANIEKVYIFFNHLKNKKLKLFK